MSSKTPYKLYYVHLDGHVTVPDDVQGDYFSITDIGRSTAILHPDIIPYLTINVAGVVYWEKYDRNTSLSNEWDDVERTDIPPALEFLHVF